MMSTRRTAINVLTFLVASFLLTWFGATNFLLVQGDGPRLFATFEDASGIQARNDVTMRGIPVGQVGVVELTDENLVDVEIKLDAGVVVPDGTIAEIVRRSPIGELTLELQPGDGEPLANGAKIDVGSTIPPPDVSKTIEVMADVLHSVPSDDLNTVVEELATGVKGRGDDLGSLARSGADLPERLLEIETELEALIRTGPQVTGVLAENADTLADDITQTAKLAGILRDKRYDLVSLSKNGADFLTISNGILTRDKANLACFLRDSGDINQQLAKEKSTLGHVLDKNHFFFDAVALAVQKGLDNANWFRVQLLPHQEPSGATYTPHRDVPNVHPGDACVSRYGRGVEAAKGRVRLAPESRLVRP